MFITCPYDLQLHSHRQVCLSLGLRNSATGTRTRVARVRAEYPNQLDYSGFWQTEQTWCMSCLDASNRTEMVHDDMSQCAYCISDTRWEEPSPLISWNRQPWKEQGTNTHRGARTHDHKVKGLALCRLS